MEYRIVHSILFVVPGREIDHFQAETIIRYTEGLLRQQCFRLLVFDLADTVFMDSAGVGMMIGLYREIRAWGGAVYIIRMQSGVRRIYRMAGLHKIIPCYEDVSAVLAAVEGGGAGMRDKMRLTMNAIAENEYFARVTVAAFSAKMDPTMEELSDIKTAVSEAVTNAVVHGYDGKGGSVEIRAEIRMNGWKLKLRTRESGWMMWNWPWSLYTHRVRKQIMPAWALHLWRRLWMSWK